MPFKIVETIEQGKSQLSICPSQWENNGILKWPKKKAAKKSKCENLDPGADWIKLNCILKRQQIQNYEDAEMELNVMLLQSDSECDNDRNRQLYSIQLPDNLNSIAEEILATTSTTTTEQDNTTVEYVVIPDETDSLQNKNFDQILQNQKDILNNQHKIMMFMANINVNMEKLITKTKSNINLDTVTSLSQDLRKNSSNNAITFSCIKNESELKSFDEQLSNEGVYRELKSKYSIVCSSGKGIDCAYRLIDVFITREFLTKCSWTGCTRGVGSKVCIKTYDNFLKFFFSLVHDCDPAYTIEDNDQFFKAIVKNAMKRNNAKFQRTTVSRNTPKRMKMNDVNANDNRTNENKENENDNRTNENETTPTE